MRKVRKLSFLGILSVLTVVVFLAGISFMQAQVQAKSKPPDKPGKPPSEPEATWAVRLPTSGMFYGTAANGYYKNNDSSIKVSVKKNTPGALRKYYNFVYSFDFKLTNENVGTSPPAYTVGFQNVGSLYDDTYPDGDKPRCQFPTKYEAPYCMAAFLNNIHPYSDDSDRTKDYEFFCTHVSVFDKDIELMKPGETYVFGSASDPGEPGDYFEMVLLYRKDCFPEPAAYHDVEIDRNINYSRALESGNPLNIVIERLATYDIECERVWRIWVLPVDSQGLEGFLKVQELYCTIEKNKTKWYYPMEAKGRFDFYIDFIKNPIK